jgi:hypothetical protein
LAVADGILALAIRDNGRGITAEQLSAINSLGILEMRERSLLLGGELVVKRRSSIRDNSHGPDSSGNSENAGRRTMIKVLIAHNHVILSRDGRPSRRTISSYNEQTEDPDTISTG